MDSFFSLHLLLDSSGGSGLLGWLTQPWGWFLSGSMIALVMLLLLLMEKSFGVSSTLRTFCAVGGAGRRYDFFKFDWKSGMWNIVFIGGAVIGGFIAHFFLNDGSAIALSAATVADLQALAISTDTTQLAPVDIFSWESLLSLRGLVFVVGGGFLVGFGARYAGGCTSGHAISGLANLQLPSLIAVVGFFIGGLLMTHLLLPFLVQL